MQLFLETPDSEVSLALETTPAPVELVVEPRFGGASSLGDNGDVVITSAASGDFLRHNGTNWVDSTIQASDIPSAIDAAKIGTGTVSNTEFGYLDGVSSSIQTQFAGKASTSHNHDGTYSPLGHQHPISDITDLQTELDGKEDAITAGTSAQYWRGDKTFQNFNSAALAAAPAETTTTIGTLINGATGKGTPVDGDQVALMDSEASNILKKLSWSNIKLTLKSYFDTLYQSVLVSGTNIKSINGNSLLGSGDLTVSGTGGGGAWGDITGTLADQTDLQDALDAKQDVLPSITDDGNPASKLKLESGSVALGDVDGVASGGFFALDGVGGSFSVDIISIVLGSVTTTITAPSIALNNIPTSNPAEIGRLWNDNGVVRIGDVPPLSFGATKGTATLDFGTGAGTNSVTVTVTDANITPTSSVFVRKGNSTADHNAVEHLIVPMEFQVSNIVDGVSFDITAFTDFRLTGDFAASYLIN